jgi:hypothetical protein
MTESAVHVRVIEETPAYWRVVFDYPPFNIVDACGSSYSKAQTPSFTLPTLI